MFIVFIWIGIKGVNKLTVVIPQGLEKVMLKNYYDVMSLYVTLKSLVEKVLFGPQG